MERFYCRYEGGYSQRHLGESRAAEETIRQNMANRLDETIREEKDRSGRERQRYDQERGQKRKNQRKKTKKRVYS